MNCPFCGYTKSKVTNKREAPEGIRRRRECLKCENRYTTYEQVSKQDLYVIKKDNIRQPFDISKIEKGLDRVFLKRPVSKEKIHSIAKSIEEQFRKAGKKEIQSKKIGEMLMRKIKKLDKVAYVRFASVYRDFKDVEDFQRQLEELQ
jgi:transcriptional repressor NrdR